MLTIESRSKLKSSQHSYQVPIRSNTDSQVKSDSQVKLNQMQAQLEAQKESQKLIFWPLRWGGFSMNRPLTPLF